MNKQGVTLSFSPLGGAAYAVGVLGLSDYVWRMMTASIDETQIPEVMTTRLLRIPSAVRDAPLEPWTCSQRELQLAPQLGLADLRRLFGVCACAGVYEVATRPGWRMGLIGAGRVEGLRVIGREDHITFEDGAGAEYTLRCAFPLLRLWRWGSLHHEASRPPRHDDDIVTALNEMQSYFAIAKSGPKPSAEWLITGIWGARRTLTTDLKPARRLQERDLEPAGTRTCWRCGRVTEAYVDRAGNRHTFRCGHCGYPIGRSASY